MSSIYMTIDEIKRRLREGADLDVVADLNGCTKGEIKQMLETENTKPVVPLRQLNDPIDKSLWPEWYEKGLTAGQIALEAQCSPGAVYAWIRSTKRKTKKQQKPVKHETVIKPQLPKPEQEPVVEPVKAWVEESEEKEMEKTSTRDIEVKLDPAILDECFDEAVKKILKQGSSIAPPPYRDEWQQYRIAQIAEWIVYCAGNLMPIDPAYLNEYSEVVR